MEVQSQQRDIWGEVGEWLGSEGKGRGGGTAYQGGGQYLESWEGRRPQGGHMTVIEGQVMTH